MASATWQWGPRTSHFISPSFSMINLVCKTPSHCAVTQSALYLMT